MLSLILAWGNHSTSATPRNLVGDRKERDMTRTSKTFVVGLVTILVTGVLVLASTDVRAGTLKWRQSWHSTKTKSVVPVGDVPDHLVGVGEGGGVAFFETGEFATFSSTYAVDYTKSGRHWAFSLYTFEEGSTFVTRNEGTTTADLGGKISVLKGT